MRAPERADDACLAPDDRDAGFVGGFEGLLFGVLIFIVGILLVGFAWGVIDTKAATGLAARDAARTYTEGSGPSTALGDAEQAAARALEGYGRNPGRARVGLTSGSFGRCARVTFQVTYPAPLVQLPVIGSLGRGVSVTSRQSELVDPYRSGLAGTAQC